MTSTVRTGVVFTTATLTMLGAVSALACTCVEVARAVRVERADIVFEGKFLEQRVIPPSRVECKDGREAPLPEATCVVARFVSSGCVPWKGVKVHLLSRTGQTLQVQYTPGSGVAKFCRLPADTYRLHATAPGLNETFADVRLVSPQGVPVMVTIPDYSPTIYVTKFSVERVSKGPKLQQVEITTWSNDGSCGFGSFEPSKRYEVFAKTRLEWPPRDIGGVTGSPPPASSMGGYVADLCGGIKPLEANSK